MTRRISATLNVLKTELAWLIQQSDGSEESKNKLFDMLDLYHDCISGACHKNRLQKYEMQIAKQMVADWMTEEYGSAHFADDIPNGDFSIAYTELGDENQFPVTVYMNLVEHTVKFWLVDGTGGQWIPEEEERYVTLDQMMDQCLEWLDFGTLVGAFNPYIVDDADLPDFDIIWPAKEK